MAFEELLTGLFRTEFSKMVAVISKYFGLAHLDWAEDVVSETFMQASERWKEDGLPPNPTAWLYVVAKRKALQHIRRHAIYESHVKPHLPDKFPNRGGDEIDFSETNIKDSQLQMMFAICHPAITSEAQIGLALRVLCGFGIDIIARAFFSNKETINKRLFRAKEKLRKENISLDMPPADELTERLDNVLHIIYLLFNEGYYSNSDDQVLRKDLCLEAMRLGIMLTQNSATNRPSVNALMALMCFHASRFESRVSDNKVYVLYEHQDETLWDQELITLGKYYLDRSAEGDDMSTYHLEAGIAFWHCQKEDSPEKWQHILTYYDLLLQINYTPAAALNRIYALYKAEGVEVALVAAHTLAFTTHHFYYVLLGELYSNTDKAEAKYNFEKALAMATSKNDKQLIQQKIAALSQDEKV